MQNNDKEHYGRLLKQLAKASTQLWNVSKGWLLISGSWSDWRVAQSVEEPKNPDDCSLLRAESLARRCEIETRLTSKERCCSARRWSIEQAQIINYGNAPAILKRWLSFHIFRSMGFIEISNHWFPNEEAWNRGFLNFYVLRKLDNLGVCDKGCMAQIFRESRGGEALDFSQLYYKLTTFQRTLSPGTE